MKKQKPLIDLIRNIVKEERIQNKALLYPQNKKQLKEIVQKVIKENLIIIDEDEDE